MADEPGESSSEDIQTASDDLIEPRNVSDAGIWYGYGEEDGLVWEESCERLYGIEPGSFEGTHEAWIKRVYPDDRERVENEWWNAMAENRPYQMVYRIIRPDGAVRWIDTRAVIFTDENGNYERAVGVDTDITKRLERFQQVQVLERVLRHNLRNDVNVIQSYAELLASSVSGELATYAEEILSKCEDLMEKSHKQQSISRLLAGRSEPRSVDVGVMVSEIVDAIEDSYPDASIQRNITTPASAPVVDGFDEAVAEILENAIEHNDQEQPMVTVAVEASNKQVHLLVADTGPGIPDHERKVVTGERAITQLEHASGLGLWLVSWIVRRTNGSIYFDDNEPRGTIVRIEISTPDYE
jgi:PAS domain S-box-containing protein